VDTSVPLFGVKFIMLFITFCVLLLFLALFAAILTCSNILVRFKFSKHFKPLMDAYQKPFKKQFHYWAGLHLAVRIVFWGLSFLNENINLISSILLLGLIICVHEGVAPYYSKVKNIIETLFLLNLYSIVVVVCAYDKSNVVVSILIILAMVKLVCIIALLNTNLQIHFKAAYNFITRFHFQKLKGIKRKEVAHQTEEPLLNN